MSISGKWINIRVSDLTTGKSKANVKIPMSLADFGMKMASKYASFDFGDLNLTQILAAMESDGVDKLVDVEDEEKGEHIEIFVQ